MKAGGEREAKNGKEGGGGGGRGRGGTSSRREGLRTGGEKEGISDGMHTTHKQTRGNERTGEQNGKTVVCVCGGVGRHLLLPGGVPHLEHDYSAGGGESHWEDVNSVGC